MDVVISINYNSMTFESEVAPANRQQLGRLLYNEHV